MGRTIKNKITTDMRINAEAQLKNAREFERELERLSDSFEIDSSIGKNLAKAKNEASGIVSILSKMQNKHFLDNDELKNIQKVIDALPNLVNNVNNLFKNTDSRQLVESSRAFTKALKEQNDAIAKIKNNFQNTTGFDYDSSLKQLDKYANKIAELSDEIEDMKKLDFSFFKQKTIGELGSKHDNYKNKAADAKAAREMADKAYEQTIEKEIKNTKFSKDDFDHKITEPDSQKIFNEEKRKQQRMLSQILDKSEKTVSRLQAELEKTTVDSNDYYLIQAEITKEKEKQITLQKQQQNLTVNNELIERKQYEAKVQQEKEKYQIQLKANAAREAMAQEYGYKSYRSATATEQRNRQEARQVELVLKTDEGINGMAQQAFANHLQKIAGKEEEKEKIEKLTEDIADATGKIAIQTERMPDEGDLVKHGDEIEKAVDKSAIDLQEIRMTNTISDTMKNSASVGHMYEMGELENIFLRGGKGNEDILTPALRQRIANHKDSQAFKELQNVLAKANVNREVFDSFDSVMNRTQKPTTDLVNTIQQAVAVADSNYSQLNTVLDKVFAELKNITTDEPQDKASYSEADINKLQKYLVKGLAQSEGAFTYQPPKIDQQTVKEKQNVAENQYSNIISKTEFPLSDIKGVANNFHEAAEEAQFLGSVADDLKNKVQYFLSANFLFDKAVEIMQNAAAHIKAIDKDVVQIGLVLGKTSKEVWKNMDAYGRMADKLGTTTSEIVASTKLFYQQGLKTAEVNKMIEASAIAAALGESSMAEASNTLTSIVNSYGLSANEALAVTDKISAISIASAADFGEMSSAIEKVASASAAAGLDLDHMMGYLAKMIETTREAPANLGTGLKTIIANFSKFRIDPSAVGEDGVTLNKADEALKSVGIELKNQMGEIRDLGDVLDELGSKWDSLSRNQKAYLATSIAGTRQQSRFYSLMNNYDRTLELVEEGTDSAGSSTRQFELYQDSLTGATRRLENEWEKFNASLQKGDSILRGTIELLTGLMKIVNKIGPGMSAITAAGGVYGSRKLFNYFQKENQTKANNFNELFQQGNIQKQLYSSKDGVQLANVVGSSKQLSSFATKSIQKDVDGIKELIALQEQMTSAETSTLDVSDKVQKMLKSEAILLDDKKITINDTTKAQMANIVVTKQQAVANKVAAAAARKLMLTQIAYTAGIMIVIAAVSALIKYFAEKDKADEKRRTDAIRRTEDAKKEADQIEKLAKAYKELNKQFHLSSEERKELNSTIQELAELYPDIVSMYDEEGKAIGISNDALEEKIRLMQEAEYLALQEKEKEFGHILVEDFFGSWRKEKE